MTLEEYLSKAFCGYSLSAKYHHPLARVMEIIFAFVRPS